MTSTTSAAPPLSESSLWSCIAVSCGLALSYVLSLYIWGRNNGHDRDHPSTIKRRFVSAFCMLFISPIFVHFFGSRTLLAQHEFSQIIGFRWAGLFNACVLPLILTWILFLGPIGLMILADTRARLLLIPQYWWQSLQDLIWWRNHVVAPFTEEYTFRACMLPILLSQYSAPKAVMVAPLFFGIAHLHHMIERIRKGQPVKTALLISVFQIHYTTVFGMYSAFLFVRTGHIAAPVIVHSFCNFMGFPDFGEMLNRPSRERIILLTLCVLGVVGFYLGLYTFTDPKLFENDIYTW
ncbi:hypothetical protein TCAL_12262 [Tigriopus californicus]|uniref:CAAX prenyl protease 2 n=1 Tax=Tigriopus californicus TaxID=6832 RepID=A0A553N8K1_TIGCA|nr:CAAX prenyl protease 2-like [Tigriopus californicus]TRY61767.1 hypothetical protein TCAL_12262 [Tigriopus californicus]|eukprot:TCALIF_12262-PA protein Name:"Similar to Sras CAAX prenyl protease 2 (Drosophila melanogaster)" AED:0.01 eAED:0.01 QI:0/-1/0/1/-1/1/1/0/293